MTERLYIYIADSHDPFRNLAIERALLDRIEVGARILYLWRNDAVIVVGRNQIIAAQCDADRASKDGVAIVRRLSGGGSVYHDLGNLNFSFISTREEFDQAADNEVVMRAIRNCGIACEKSGRNDLLAQGRKFSGHSYFHRAQASCHNGTIMIDVDTARLQNYLKAQPVKYSNRQVDSVRSRVVNLKDIRPDISVQKVSENLISAFEQYYGLKAQILPGIEEKLVEKYYQKFTDKNWLYPPETDYPYHRQKRFDWGSVAISYQIRDNMITGFALASDGLDEQRISEIPEQIVNREVERLKKGEYAELADDLARDIISMIEEE